MDPPWSEGSLLPLERGGPHLWLGRGEEGTWAVSRAQTSGEKKTSDAEKRGSLRAALEPSRPGQALPARTPPPAHLATPAPADAHQDLASSAAPRPGPQPRRSRGPGPAPPAQPSRRVPPYLAGGGCTDSGAAPHVPVSHIPVRHAAVRPHRATAAAASGPRPHRAAAPGARQVLEAAARAAAAAPSPARHPTHLLETGNGCTPLPIPS